MHRAEAEHHSGLDPAGWHSPSGGAENTDSADDMTDSSRAPVTSSHVQLHTQNSSHVQHHTHSRQPRESDVQIISGKQITCPSSYKMNHLLKNLPGKKITCPSSYKMNHLLKNPLGKKNHLSFVIQDESSTEKSSGKKIIYLKIVMHRIIMWRENKRKSCVKIMGKMFKDCFVLSTGYVGAAVA